MYLRGSNEWLVLTATTAAQTVKPPPYHWPPAPCWWRWCDFLAAERPNAVGSVLPRLLLWLPCPRSGGVLSPPNVYCLVVNTPCGTETLQADGQVTWGAPGSGRKNISFSPGVDVTGVASAVSLRPAEAGKPHGGRETTHCACLIPTEALYCVCVWYVNLTFYVNCWIGG